MDQSLISKYIKEMGPATLPYGRKPDQSQELLEGECDDFTQYCCDKTNNHSPEPDLQLDENECSDNTKLPQTKKYLWLIDVLDENLRLRLIPEQTENPNRKHKPIVCHSNMSICKEALQGGECWWLENSKTIFINPKSGRYGAESVEQWETVKNFFKEVGFKNIIDVIPKTWQLKEKN